MQIDPVEAAGAVATFLATAGAAARLFWKWVAKLIDQLQAGAAEDRKQFLSALDRIEDKHAESTKVLVQNREEDRRAFLESMTRLWGENK